MEISIEKVPFCRGRDQSLWKQSLKSIIRMNSQKRDFLMLGLIEYKLQNIHCELLRSFIYEGLLKVPTNVPIMK